jgi:predicted membrane chloride channel (bestrophin family)
MISIVLSFIPAIWFSIASHYKRVSALFYENRKNIFAILIGFKLISDATGLGILSSFSFLKTPFSIITVLIFIFLVFKNSDIDKDDHEG